MNTQLGINEQKKKNSKETVVCFSVVTLVRAKGEFHFKKMYKALTLHRKCDTFQRTVYTKCTLMLYVTDHVILILLATRLYIMLH